MTAASQLLSGLIGLLEDSGARYVFGRNYEGYPETLTGDIDINVEPEAVDRIRKPFERLFRATGWRVFRRQHRPHVEAYQLFRASDETGERPFLVVEFFLGFTWLGAEFMSFDGVWKRRIRHRNFWAADRLDGILSTLLHYYFWSGFLPEKYLGLWRQELEAGDRQAVVDRLNEVFPGRLAATLSETLVGLIGLPDSEWREVSGAFERRHWFEAQTRKRRQRFILRRFLKHHPGRFVVNVFALLKGGLQDLIHPPGACLQICGEGAEAAAQQLLRHAKKYHLYKNRFSCVASEPESCSKFRTWRTLVRGGLMIQVGQNAEARTSPTRGSYVVVLGGQPPQMLPPGKRMLVTSQPSPSADEVILALVRKDARPG